MTKLEEARINRQWAADMLEKGVFPAGMPRGQVAAMEDEFNAIVKDEEAREAAEQPTADEVVA